MSEPDAESSGGASRVGPADSSVRPAALEVKGQLDTLIVSIELTLVSIVQGTALGALIAVGEPALLAGHWRVWPALITGLLFILIFWSSAVAHTLSFISWPLDFTHNFLYVGVTIIEAVTISQAATPDSWFLWCTIYSTIGWVLYFTDLQLIRAARPDFRGPNADRLFEDLHSDQLRNVRLLLPGAMLFHFGAWLAVTRWPGGVSENELFALGTCQMLAFCLFLWDVVRSLRRRQGWVFQRLVEQREGRHLLLRKDEEGLDVIG